MTAPQAMSRPGGSCLTCRPPLGTRSWSQAYSGHFTCANCEDDLRRMLGDIADRYEVLDIRPGNAMELGGRPAPGFGSRAPASEHVIAMRDPRSSEVARVWVGSDGRVHSESEHPPLSVYGALLIEVYDVAERREMSLPDPIDQVRHLTTWLLRHVEWLTRQDTIPQFHDVVFRLDRQLRPLTGDPAPKKVGRCPEMVEKKGEPTRCGCPLYVPTAGDTVECRGCGKAWPRQEWLALSEALAS